MLTIPVMVIMKLGMWLPGKPRVHHNPRVIHESKIVDVGQLHHKYHGIYGHHKNWEDNGKVKEGEFYRAHGDG